MKIPSATITRATAIIRALNNPLRIRTLRYIESKGVTDVMPIYRAMKCEQSICSQHLAILRGAGLVKVLKVGRSRIYGINSSKFEIIVNGLNKVK